jgi:hypothetical protein
LAVNCFVEPVYTLDADIVISHSLNATTPVSQLRIQFTTDDRYQAFLARSVDAEVLACPWRSLAWRTSRKASCGPTAIRVGV